MVLLPSRTNHIGVPRRSPRHALAPPLVAFGQAVQARRDAAKLSQEELADMAGIDRSYMSNIERGMQNLGFMAAVQIAAALNMSLAELVAEASI